MAEPIAPASAGIGAFVISLPGTILGIHYDALILALLGGAVALLHLPPVDSSNPRWQKFSSVASSSLFGGILSPFAQIAILKYMSWLNDAPVRLGCAFLLGLFAQIAIPLAFKVLARKGETI